MWTVQSRSNFDDDGACPVPYLLLVSPVQGVVSAVLVAKYIVSYQGLHNEMMLFKYIYISFTETCTVFP